MKKNKAVNLFIAIGVLLAEYIVCRYIFYGAHQTKDIPFVLFLFCLTTSCVAIMFGKGRIATCAVVGYIASFFMGILFNVEWTDVHGTACNSFWIWFLCGTVVFTFVGLIWEAWAYVSHKNG